MTARPPRAPRQPMLTVPQAADRLGLTRWQVYDYIHAGLLACTRYPSRNGKAEGPIRIDETDVEEFKARHRQPATT